MANVLNTGLGQLGQLFELLGSRVVISLQELAGRAQADVQAGQGRPHPVVQFPGDALPLLLLGRRHLGQLLAQDRHPLLVQAGERRAEPGVQQHRVKGLGQIIRRPHLDTAHDAFHLVHR